MSYWKDFTAGFIRENPILVIMIGLCPTLAVSTTVYNGIGMGLAATFVLVGSNILISLLRKYTPHQIRIPVFIIIISTFVTIVDYFMHAYLPLLYKNLGVFVPLIVVNCIILGRAEAFAYRNNVLASTLDGLGMGLGFTLIITLMGTIREFLGNGTILGIKISALSQQPALMMILPPGAFLVIGFLMALKNLLTRK